MPKGMKLPVLLNKIFIFLDLSPFLIRQILFHQTKHNRIITLLCFKLKLRNLEEMLYLLYWDWDTRTLK